MIEPPSGPSGAACAACADGRSCRDHKTGEFAPPAPSTPYDPLFVIANGETARRVLVSVESPCAGRVPSWVPLSWHWLAAVFERVNRWRNMRYALACVRDSLARGEAPYASHVFFDRRGLLDDADPHQRRAGMACGMAWCTHADVFAFYVDRGFSSGMSAAHIAACERGASVEVRRIKRKIW
jgi:hypothetical protein